MHEENYNIMSDIYTTCHRELNNNHSKTVAMNINKNLWVWYIAKTHRNIDGLVQDCRNSITNALKLPESCTKPSIHTFLYHCKDGYRNIVYSIELEIINRWSTRPLSSICPIPTAKIRRTHVTLTFHLLTWKWYMTHWVVFVPHMNIVNEIGNEPQSGHGQRERHPDGQTDWNQYFPHNSIV